MSWTKRKPQPRFHLLARRHRPSTVDPTFPAQWVSDGDILPGLPGNLTLTATDGGFRVTSLSPDPTESHFFS